MVDFPLDGNAEGTCPSEWILIWQPEDIIRQRFGKQFAPFVDLQQIRDWPSCPRLDDTGRGAVPSKVQYSQRHDLSCIPGESL